LTHFSGGLGGEIFVDDKREQGLYASAKWILLEDDALLVQL